MVKKVEFEVADMTNPKHLALHGLKLKGRDIVTKGKEVKVGELSAEEWDRVQKTKKK
jgi:hypothetical protein